MEPADQVPRPRNRPSHNQTQQLVLSDINFIMTDSVSACDVDEFTKPRIFKISDDVDLISGGLDSVGQQYVRMRDIRWRDVRLPRKAGFKRFLEIWISWLLCTARNESCAFRCRYHLVRRRQGRKNQRKLSVYEHLERSLLAPTRNVGAHPELGATSLIVRSTSIRCPWK